MRRFDREDRRRRGFSLTEVAIAMAVISVSLVALLGLTSSSLQTSKESAAETSMTTAAREALDLLRSRSFKSLPYAEPDKEEPRPATEPAILPTIYVAADGQWLGPDRSKWPLNPDELAEAPPDAAFKCVVTIQPDPFTLTPPVLSKTGETRVNLLQVQLAMSPAAAPSTAKPTMLIHATISRQ